MKNEKHLNNLSRYFWEIEHPEINEKSLTFKKTIEEIDLDGKTVDEVIGYFNQLKEKYKNLVGLKVEVDYDYMSSSTKLVCRVKLTPKEMAVYQKLKVKK